jgi:multicomponent Na+:H+ antiporter subunit D
MIDWPVGVIALPLVGALLALAVPGRAAMIGFATSLAVLAAVIGLAGQVFAYGGVQYALGGWQAPLGIELYADGLTVAMLAMSNLVGLGITAYAAAYFGVEYDRAQAHLFWPLWLLLSTALNALFLAADLFNIYVTLELLGLAAVVLAALGHAPEAPAAAMRYLLVSMLGSLSYLLGVAFVYGASGSLSLTAIAAVIPSTPTLQVAIVLMTTGLLLKAAIFPLHFWLPPAHAHAPAPVSAALSALVVKAAIYLLWRLWFDVFPGSLTTIAYQGLGILGGAAILWGSWQALMAERLKLLAAYSTIAQVGYLCLAFPLSREASVAEGAWLGVILLALSHGFAKAGLFLAAGTTLKVSGHDRIQDLKGMSQQLPLTTFALALAGVALIGLPPSGGFLGKWTLLHASLHAGQWWWVLVLLVGTLLSAAYVFRVLIYAFADRGMVEPVRQAPWAMEWAALSLALVATIGLGFGSASVVDLLEPFGPFGAYAPTLIGS